MEEQEGKAGDRRGYGRHAEPYERSVPLYVGEVKKIVKIKKQKVRCPYCGYPVNAMQAGYAKCKGVFFKCKNKECRKEFELRV